MRHLIERAAAEVRWHEELVARMPKVAADVRDGVSGPVVEPDYSEEPR